MDNLKGKLVYVADLPMAYNASLMEVLPVSWTKLIQRVEYCYLEGGTYTMGFTNGYEIRDLISNPQFEFLFAPNSDNYIIVGLNKVALQKAIFITLKEKYKKLKTGQNNWQIGNMEREFFFYKKKLSRTIYFETYPEDFL